jgi:hypothetical protein
VVLEAELSNLGACPWSEEWMPHRIQRQLRNKSVFIHTHSPVLLDPVFPSEITLLQWLCIAAVNADTLMQLVHSKGAKPASASDIGRRKAPLRMYCGPVRSYPFPRQRQPTLTGYDHHA